MKFKNSFKRFFLGAALIAVCGCSTKYEENTLTNFVDRAKLEDVSDEEITSGSIDMKQMKDEKKLNVGILLNIQDESQGRAKLPNVEHFMNDAYELALDYLARIKSYRVVVLPKGTKENDLMTKKDFNGVKYPFLVSMHIVMNSEIEQRYDKDVAMYKTSIAWKLIDNRTKSNGLGKNDAPFIKESLTCKNVTSRKIKIGGISGRRMSGDEAANAQNAYKNTLENALIEFRAQLANRLPFGGKISAFRVRDGKVRMTLKAGQEHGVVKNMQILIMNEEGDQVAIGTATGNAKSKESTINIWRWLSKSLKKEITDAASDKKKMEEYLDEEGNGLYGICLGMPTPSKDERTQIKDFESRGL